MVNKPGTSREEDAKDSSIDDKTLVEDDKLESLHSGVSFLKRHETQEQNMHGDGTSIEEGRRSEQIDQGSSGELPLC